jgi:hypothetical protein
VVAFFSAMMAGPSMVAPALQRLAHVQAGVEPAARSACARGPRARGWRGGRRRRPRRRGKPLAGGHGLHRHRLDHQRAVGHQEGEALPVGGLERVGSHAASPKSTTSAVSVPW